MLLRATPRTEDEYATTRCDDRGGDRVRGRCVGNSRVGRSPSNDQESGAIPIGALPFTTSQDTTEATASGPNFCPTRASVFYSFTPSVTERVQVDTIGSDYDTILGVYRRTNTCQVRAMRCDDDRFGLTSGVRFRAVAGKTYIVMTS